MWVRHCDTGQHVCKNTQDISNSENYGHIKSAGQFLNGGADN